MSSLSPTLSNKAITTSSKIGNVSKILELRERELERRRWKRLRARRLRRRKCRWWSIDDDSGRWEGWRQKKSLMEHEKGWSAFEEEAP